jgi:hypothetical protein
MANVCRRCIKSNMGKCSEGYNKTDSQIRNENYICFNEKYYNINNTKHHPDYEYNPYGNEITYRDIKPQLDLIRQTWRKNK